MATGAELVKILLKWCLVLGLFGGAVGTPFYVFLRGKTIPKDKKIKEIIKVYVIFSVIIFVLSFLLLYFTCSPK